jgi:hypothetical protein
MDESPFGKLAAPRSRTGGAGPLYGAFTFELSRIVSGVCLGMVFTWVRDRHTVAREEYLERRAGEEEEDRAEARARAARDGIDLCRTCDGFEEISCAICSGKGFSVDADARPQRCQSCQGLGRITCPECAAVSSVRAEGKQPWNKLFRRGELPPAQLPPPHDDWDI